MTTKTFIPSSRAIEQIKRNVDLGWQCPDCFGIQIELQPRQPHDLHRYQCQECGCQWSRS